ncbi:hypothetical protein J7T55_011583 [Diaporthe amygdali]|uniref:uncharacterized protein n=1 Tax=Phomopsis amygdali TaxID=1214568 RepID=UPI0022FE82BA|nr:uncharacterized protein J7T55_011583 [Diaporthe amygdali]KAJ0123119.1 hypothetical protein J7T55_011583 [Diaporthe amygdali]
MSKSKRQRDWVLGPPQSVAASLRPASEYPAQHPACPDGQISAPAIWQQTLSFHRRINHEDPIAFQSPRPTNARDSGSQYTAEGVCSVPAVQAATRHPPKVCIAPRGTADVAGDGRQVEFIDAQSSKCFEFCVRQALRYRPMFGPVDSCFQKPPSPLIAKLVEVSWWFKASQR